MTAPVKSGGTFHRGLTLCHVVPGPDGWEWWAYLAVNKDHPLHGCHFHELPSGTPLAHVTHDPGLSHPDTRWWFVVGNLGLPSESAALRTLLVTSDEVTAMILDPDAMVQWWDDDGDGP